MRALRFGILTWCAWWAALTAQAQRPAPARLVLTILDPSGSRVPNVVVTVFERDGVLLPTPRTYLGPYGRIVIDDVAPGVYSFRTDAAGFGQVLVRGLRVAGEVRHTVRLALHVIADPIVVEAEPQRAALDPRGFSTILTREQIDALPDDPDEMAAALRDLAPPGAVIRIDGFPGGLMPPKSQILMIRLPRLDSYAAQDHGGLTALSFIEVVTTPGGGRLQGGADLSWRHQAFNARHPLTHLPPADAARVATVALDGPLVRNAASFALSIRGGRLDTPAPVNAIGADGAPLSDAPIRRRDWMNITGRVVASIAGQTARVSVSAERRRTQNAGVGGLNLRNRAYQLSSADWTVRAASSGPVGRRLALDARFEVRRSGERAVSSVEAPTLRVLDAFHDGGAQVAGGERATDVWGAVDVEYGRGIHAVRAGVLVERNQSRSARHVNYLGTYTFASLEAYRAGQPATYTRRIGRPVSELTNFQFAAYAQDDVRVSRALLAGYGVRYERQSLRGGSGRVLPRGSLAWSPRPSGATTMRAGAGLFSEWMSPAVFHQSRSLDGSGQFDVIIHQPPFPVPGESGERVRRERYGLAPGLDLPLVVAASVGVEQQVGGRARLHAAYSRRVAWRLLRGEEVALPADGRSGEGSGRLVHATSDAGLRTHTVTVQASTTGAGRRASGVAVYVYSHTLSNTAGAFATPPGGDLDAEWGPTVPAHTFTASANVRIYGPVSLSFVPRWRSGIPYSITSGTDDNQDGLFTERPAGTPRHSGRTPPHFDLGARLSFVRRFGPGTGELQAPNVAPVTGGGSRYRVELFVAAQNVTNRPTYTAVGSVIDSPMFGKPLAALDPRRIELGVRLSF